MILCTPQRTRKSVRVTNRELTVKLLLLLSQEEDKNIGGIMGGVCHGRSAMDFHSGLMVEVMMGRVRTQAIQSRQIVAGVRKEE